MRDEAPEIYANRAGELREFDRSWWKRFKMKHDEVFTTCVHAIEGHRVEVLQSDIVICFKCHVGSHDVIDAKTTHQH